MRKKYLGIEIGNLTVKLAVIEQGRVEHFFIEKIPDGIIKEDEVVALDEMATFIKSICKKYSIHCKEVAMILSERHTYIRRLTLPMMTIKQLKVNLPFEFHDFVSGAKDDYFYDYIVLNDPKENEMIEEKEGEEPSKKQRELELLGCAVSKELIRNYKEMFKKCGLKLTMALPEMVAYQSMIFYRVEQANDTAEKDYAIVDLGHDYIHLYLFLNGKYETGRNIEPGLKEITMQIAQFLSVDQKEAEEIKQKNKNNILNSEFCQEIYGEITLHIMRAINFFTFNYQNNTLDTLYYCGGGANITPLIEVLKNTVPLQIKSFSELFPQEDKAAVLAGASTIGIHYNKEGK